MRYSSQSLKDEGRGEQSRGQGEAEVPPGYHWWREGDGGWQADGWDPAAAEASLLGPLATELRIALEVMTGEGPWKTEDRLVVAQEWVMWASTPGTVLPDWEGPTTQARGLWEAVLGDGALRRRIVRSPRSPDDLLRVALSDRDREVRKLAFRNKRVPTAEKMARFWDADPSWQAVAVSKPGVDRDLLLACREPHLDVRVRVAALGNPGFPEEDFVNAAVSSFSLEDWATISSWERCDSIVQAVLRDPGTPPTVAIAVCRGLERRWWGVGYPRSPVAWSYIGALLLVNEDEVDRCLVRRRPGLVHAAAGMFTPWVVDRKGREQPALDWRSEHYDPAFVEQFEAGVYLAAWELAGVCEEPEAGRLAEEALEELRTELMADGSFPRGRLGPTRLECLRWLGQWTVATTWAKVETPGPDSSTLRVPSWEVRYQASRWEDGMVACDAILVERQWAEPELGRNKGVSRPQPHDISGDVQGTSGAGTGGDNDSC